jgi:hypothetical protein
MLVGLAILAVVSGVAVHAVLTSLYNPGEQQSDKPTLSRKLR